MYSVYHVDIHALVLYRWSKVSIHHLFAVHLIVNHMLLEDWAHLKKLLLCTAVLGNISEEDLEGILPFMSKSRQEAFIHFPLHD